MLSAKTTQHWREQSDATIAEELYQRSYRLQLDEEYFFLHRVVAERAFQGRRVVIWTVEALNLWAEVTGEDPISTAAVSRPKWPECRRHSLREYDTSRLKGAWRFDLEGLAGCAQKDREYWEACLRVTEDVIAEKKAAGVWENDDAPLTSKFGKRV